MNRLAYFAVLGALASCGGGGSDPSTTDVVSTVTVLDPPPPTDPPPLIVVAPTYSPFEGVWTGSDLVVDGSGNYWAEQAIPGTCAAYESNAFLADGSSAGNTAYTAANTYVYQSPQWNEPGIGCTYPEQFSLSVAIADGALVLSGTWNASSIYVNQDAETPQSGAWTSTYNKVASSMVPSLSTIAGNWTTLDGAIATITADGAFTLNDQTELTQCNISGQVTISDPNTNVYTVTVSTTGTCTQDGNDIDAPVSGTGVFTYGPEVGTMHGGIAVGTTVMMPLDAEAL